ncbi:MAG: DEAD/DEAH box helicase [Kiritimatiellae bacterium]|nr:DEAD/DEAH box helicase [Kiritimatiellia bacterium]
MHTDHSVKRPGKGRRPFRRRKNRHPGLAEHDAPVKIPVPKGELPEAFAENAFGTLNPLIQHAVAEDGYLAPTPIQERSIPVLLEGRDLLGCAQTGTGKTAAFLLPILHRLAANPKEIEPKHPRALVLAPTRELAAQIAQCCADYGKFLGTQFAVVFGGVSQAAQVKALTKGAEIVIATPGRLFDLMQQKYAFLDKIEEFVLDEADRMLDMGFLPDIKKVIAFLPDKRHSQFFSATLSKEVMKLAQTLVKDPVTIEISPDQPTVDKINQQLMFVDKGNKCNLLIHILHTHPEYEKVLVFARTRHGADKIVRKLAEAEIKSDAIHSDKTQAMRTRALAAFKKGKTRVLVATDIASRGIDVDNITHVFNYDLPEETESYVHRIGRTARAGASGAAISFVSADERGLLRAIERMIKKEIEIDRNQPYHSETAERAAGKAEDGLPPPEWMRGKGAGRKSRDRKDRRERLPSNKGRMQKDFHKRERDVLEEERPQETKTMTNNEKESRFVPPPDAVPSEEAAVPAPEPADLPAPTHAPEDPPAKAEKEPWYAKPYRSNGHHLPGDPMPRGGRYDDDDSRDRDESPRRPRRPFRDRDDRGGGRYDDRPRRPFRDRDSRDFRDRDDRPRRPFRDRDDRRGGRHSDRPFHGDDRPRRDFRDRDDRRGDEGGFSTSFGGQDGYRPRFGGGGGRGGFKKRPGGGGRFNHRNNRPR